ncbi:MAG: hypothetical protein OXQ26_02075 [bacterium]|nr:hypothetical protein [bacterium]
MTPTKVLDATLEPGISNGRPVAVFRSVDHHTGDEVRLRVTKRGHHNPDHIATYRVFPRASTRSALPAQGGAGDRPRTDPDGLIHQPASHRDPPPTGVAAAPA